MAKIISSPAKLLKGKGLLILLAIVLIGLLVWAVIAIPDLLQPLVITLAVLVVGWLAIHFGRKAWRGRKQDAFDDAVTAKEGIDDRKREWGAWAAELKKQGIDRYELPFYLLVGEPQSGKSVLLQNSDLHFPFGQTRLSGVGGTRGCDWWFTDEAVILDLAGRLFTHEGGAADQLEWEAFLDLLFEFRPLCPANGVLLVLPCDGLMRDTPDECAEKANKIQQALLTLTKKLQAQIPIYLVLTKGDQVFGFAECMHRLDAVKRHEMFGWSRDADRLESPFDLEEARHGFGEMVERTRVLCSEMLVSARIPEALGEVDRMIVFPDELAGTWNNLEAYLKRIFTESGLVDRLYFRGLYLTSGLQTGVPVARLCSALLGSDGAADQQDLSGLFAKQRAYFIKDLIRKRVFSERGLVRPTEGRVLRARRNALVGYGASALIALGTIVASVVHLATGEGEEAVLLRAAIDSVDAMRTAEGARGERDLRAVLGVLEDVDAAILAERSKTEEMFDSTRDSFSELYVEVFDRDVMGRVREAAVRQVQTELASEPASYDALVALSDLAELLLSEIDLEDGGHRDALLRAVPGEQQMAPPKGGALALGEGFDLRGAIRKRIEYGDADPIYKPSGESVGLLLDMARGVLARWDGALAPGSPWQVREELGYLVAWMGVDEAFTAFDSETRAEDPELLRHCQIYARSYDVLDEIQPGLELVSEKTGRITRTQFQIQLASLAAKREPHAAFVARNATPGGGTPGDWAAQGRIELFAEKAFAEGAQSTAFGTSTRSEAAKFAIEAAGDAASKARAEVIVPNSSLSSVLDDAVKNICTLGPAPDWQPGELAGVLRKAQEREVISLDPAGRPRRSSELPAQLFLANLAVTGTAFADTYRSWTALPGVGRGGLDAELVASLGELRSELLPFSEVIRGGEGFVDAIEALLYEHLQTVDARWEEEGPPSGSMDWSLHASLLAAHAPGRGANKTLNGLARDLGSRYLDQYHGALLDEWSGFPKAAAETALLLEAVAEHFSVLETKFPSREALDEDQAVIAWRQRVDTLLTDRLTLLEEDLRANWSVPRQTLQGSLAAVAIEIGGMMSQRQIDERSDAARDLGAHVLEQATFDPGAEVYRDLPNAADTLQRLRGLRTPSRTAFNGLPFVQSQLETLVDRLQRLKSQPGPPVANLLFELHNQAPRDVPEDAGLFYAHRLYDALHGYAIDELRAAIARDLKAAMEKEFSRVMTVLYVDDLDELDDLARFDRDMSEELAALMDRGMWLDDLHQEYHLDKVDGDPNALIGLRPSEAELELDENRDWWDFERFLTQLQTFLLGAGAEDLRSAKLSIGFRPEIGAEIWDLKETELRWGWFYYPLTEKGVWEPTAIDSEDMPEKTLVWSLRPGTEKNLKMRWSASTDSDTKWRQKDARFELRGTLAPILLAWAIGERKRDGWLVEIEPGNSRWIAPFHMRFLGQELPDRPPEPH